MLSWLPKVLSQLETVEYFSSQSDEARILVPVFNSAVNMQREMEDGSILFKSYTAD